MTTTKNQFGTVYHQYPVFSQDDWATGGGVGFEGAQKRFTSFPQPRDVLSSALMGMPKVFPLTNELITPDHIQPYLDSATTELEMSMGIDISPVERDQAFDYIDGMFEGNFTGLKLQGWPATKVIEVQLRFPHAVGSNTYQEYSIPAPWIALRRNRINVLASFGAVSLQTNNANSATAASVFSYITGFTRGAYQPAMISVRYVSGFDNDRLPTVLADLIKTWAGWRFLSDNFSALAPTSGVSVSIDGISQSSNINLGQMLIERIKLLDQKRQQQMNAITKAFGRTIKVGFIGS